MEKRWFIKINVEDNLYYDSDKKVYRLRLPCVHCGKPSSCQCYESYEDYECDKLSEFPSRCCSYLCCLLVNPDGHTENIRKAVQDLGIGVKPLAEYTEEEAGKIVDYIVGESIWDIDEDSAGEECGT